MSMRMTSLLALALLLANTAAAQSLQGSKASVRRQNLLAQNYDYTFLPTAQDVNRFVESGYLVRIVENPYLEIHNVSYPYARPEVKLFLERLSVQYHSACGQKLTVTSLTRPLNKQPNNASSSSVHPTGMAVDLRIPSGKCRSWLEGTLLSLEKTDVLDATRERNPPHYHVAVFTKQYQNYVASLNVEGPANNVSSKNVSNTNLSNTNFSVQEYIVRRGDTLSRIADKTGTSVKRIKAVNGIRGDLIQVGQKLQIQAVANEHSGQIAAVSEVLHKVRRGDTLWRIASLYSSSVKSIRSANAISDDFLQIGQVLTIPLGSD